MGKSSENDSSKEGNGGGKRAGASSPLSVLPTAMTDPFGWARGEFERLMESMRGPGSTLSSFTNWSILPMPALEMSEQDKEYRLTAELPGLAEQDVEISVADGILSINGHKQETEEKKSKGHMFSERRYGAFKRQMSLPADVDPAKINASFKDGVLIVTMAKDANVTARTRKIPIGKG